MHLLPEFDQRIKMRRRRKQDSANVGTLRVAWADGISSIRDGNGSVSRQVNNYFCLIQESMDVARRVVLRVGHKEHTCKSSGCHLNSITQAG